MCVVVVVLLGLAGVVRAGEGESNRLALELAKGEFEGHVESLAGELLERLEEREAAARKKGDSAAVTRLVWEREDFVAKRRLPRSVIVARQALEWREARNTLMKVYQDAVTELLQAKQDDEAAAVDRELWEFLQPMIGDRLHQGDSLMPTDFLMSASCKYMLTFEPGGNLALYKMPERKRLWQTQPKKGETYCFMQHDGNFVMRDRRNRGLWDSGSHGHPNSYLVVQGDGNVVIYDGKQGTWSTDTVQRK